MTVNFFHRGMRVRTCAVAGLVASLLVASLNAGYAQQTSRSFSRLALTNDQPIQIESDRLEIREQQGTALFTGNVKVVQGETVMQSGEMTVYYVGESADNAAEGPDTIDRIEVADKVFVQSGTQQATGDTGSFDMISEVLVLSGEQVVLSDGGNVFVGCKLTVRMRDGEAQLESCGTGRVEIMLDPKSRQSN